MSKQFVCDVCGEAFELDQPHVEFTVQEGMEGAVPDGQWDICSWECVYDLTLAATMEKRMEEGDDVEVVRVPASLAEAIVDDVHEQQIVIDKQDRTYAKDDIQDAGVGVYFPEGMRVDGRPADQVRPRVRLQRVDE